MEIPRSGLSGWTASAPETGAATISIVAEARMPVWLRPPVRLGPHAPGRRRQAIIIRLANSYPVDVDDFTLPWPFGGIGHQSSSDGILPYVEPLFVIAFTAPNDVIKESSLPMTGSISACSQGLRQRAL